MRNVKGKFENICIVICVRKEKKEKSDVYKYIKVFRVVLEVASFGKKGVAEVGVGTVYGCFFVL